MDCWARSARCSAARRNSGRNLKDGLDSLVDRFRTAGHGEKADSWVSSGDNAGIEESELETALGADTLDELAAKTGLSRAEILNRLKTTLPDTIHRLTPDGRVPSESEAKTLV
ncbi:MAG: YidB family protein [Amaricoccus sp.]|uniref:YidB family protein n=1 Tax=Amaricoccus sp. TaxID=1872485 RepID=UPI0039E61617